MSATARELLRQALFIRATHHFALPGRATGAGTRVPRCRCMSRLPWETMVAQHCPAHLVVGVVSGGGAAPSARLLIRLLDRFDLKRNWAIAVIEEPSGETVHCAFESAADADKLANTFIARPTGSYPGWLSERSFSLDATARKAILAGLNSDR
jgi:hypothetical protein